MVKSFIHIEKSLIIIVEFYKHRLFFPVLINQIVAYLNFNDALEFLNVPLSPYLAL